MNTALALAVLATAAAAPACAPGKEVSATHALSGGVARWRESQVFYYFDTDGTVARPAQTGCEDAANQLMGETMAFEAAARRAIA